MNNRRYDNHLLVCESCRRPGGGPGAGSHLAAWPGESSSNWAGMLCCDTSWDRSTCTTIIIIIVIIIIIIIIIITVMPPVTELAPGLL